MYLVFDVGGTFIKYGIMDKEGKISSKDKIPTTYDGREALINSLVEVYNNNSSVEGIALSVPGQVDVEKGIIYNGGALTFMHECNIVKELSKRCDNKPVAVENDAKCAGLAEASIGAAKDVQDAVILVLGTGLGGCVIENGKVKNGNRMIVGEFSFLMPRIEDKNKVDMMANYVSASGITKGYDRLAGQKPGTATGEEVFLKASQGDVNAVEALENVYRATAILCYNLQYIADPDVICIGGGVSQQDCLIEGIKRHIKHIFDNNFQLVMPKVVRCQFDADSNLIGALFNLLQQINN